MSQTVKGNQDKVTNRFSPLLSDKENLLRMFVVEGVSEAVVVVVICW
jgi:hypothetical protein